MACQGSVAAMGYGVMIVKNDSLLRFVDKR